MRVYIEEAGLFVPPSTEPHSYSLVLALAIPSRFEEELFYEFPRLRDGWPIKGVEIKGSKLDESQVAGLVELVSGYDVVVDFFAIDKQRTAASSPATSCFATCSNVALGWSAAAS